MHIQTSLRPLVIKAQVDEIFDELDLNDTGVINYSEFLAATLEAQLEDGIPENHIQDAFERLEDDMGPNNSGAITAPLLRAVLESTTTAEEEKDPTKRAEEIIGEVAADGSK